MVMVLFFSSLLLCWSILRHLFSRVMCVLTGSVFRAVAAIGCSEEAVNIHIGGSPGQIHPLGKHAVS